MNTLCSLRVSLSSAFKDFKVNGLPSRGIEDVTKLRYDLIWLPELIKKSLLNWIYSESATPAMESI